MSSFLFEKEQIHCTCFDNSPKNGPRIFRIDPNSTIKSNMKEIKQTSGRNASDQTKHKKKSLKKGRQLSNVGSEKDDKEKQQAHNSVFVPFIQMGQFESQGKKEQKMMGFDFFQHPNMIPIVTQRSKPVHNIRSQRPHAPYEPIYFEQSHRIPVNIQSQKFIVDDSEYDKKITQQFEKDFLEFKIQMDLVESKKPNLQKGKATSNQESPKRSYKPQSSPQIPRQENKINKQPTQIVRKKEEFKFLQPTEIIKKTEVKAKIKSRRGSTSQNKINFQNKEEAFQIKYPNTELTLPVNQNQMVERRVASFRGSRADSGRQRKTSISKKNKEKTFQAPKEIESVKGSSSSSSSDRLSEVVGRGIDGMTEKRMSEEESMLLVGKEKRQIQTMATQQSHIQHSQIKSFTDYSNSLISPKSLHSKGLAFGATNKYGAAGLSYQHIEDFRRPKINSFSKFNI